MRYMRKPLIETDIPIIAPEEDVLKGALKAFVDDKPALIAIVEQDWGSTKIAIHFEDKDQNEERVFATKYFFFKEDEPGVLHWGHDGDTMKIEA